jgi:hypothetical protein
VCVKIGLAESGKSGCVDFDILGDAKKKKCVDCRGKNPNNGVGACRFV